MLLSTFDETIGAFFERIGRFEKEHIDVHSDDVLLERITDILDGRIGPAPSKEELTTITSWAERRFSVGMPPGYEDKGKDGSKSPAYTYGGRTYEAKYGDAIIWWQILEFAKTQKPDGLIFVTDDAKPDWWNIVSSSGPKTIGPRQELIDEMATVGTVERFWMYSTYRFLDNAKVGIGSTVSSETIRRVKDISHTLELDQALEPDKLYDLVERYLRLKYPAYVIKRDFMPDFVLGDIFGEDDFGVEVIAARSGRPMLPAIRSRAQAIIEDCDPKAIVHVDLYIICANIAVADDVRSAMSRVELTHYINAKVMVTVPDREGQITIVDRSDLQ